MLGLFQKRQKTPKKINIKSPVTGRCFDLMEIPDQAFASGMLGDGFGVESGDGVIYAPAAGEVLQIFPTKHALILKTKEGLELLIHIGVGTVAMNGEGFETHVEVGSKVKASQKLISFDKILIKAKAKTDLSSIVIVNRDLVEQIQFYYGNKERHSLVATVTLK